MGKVIVGSIVALAVVVALAIGSWHLGWFIEEANVNRGAEVSQKSYGRQDALSQAIVDDYQEVMTIDVQITATTNPQAKGALIAQRKAITDGICDKDAISTGRIELPFAIQNFIDTECV